MEAAVLAENVVAVAVEVLRRREVEGTVEYPVEPVEQRVVDGNCKREVRSELAQRREGGL